MSRASLGQQISVPSVFPCNTSSTPPSVFILELLVTFVHCFSWRRNLYFRHLDYHSKGQVKDCKGAFHPQEPHYTIDAMLAWGPRHSQILHIFKRSEKCLFSYETPKYGALSLQINIKGVSKVDFSLVSMWNTIILLFFNYCIIFHKYIQYAGPI